MTVALPLLLERPPELAMAVRDLAQNGGHEARGAVFTKATVVDAILDLCGYSDDRDLAALRLLEPAFGDGDFLLPVVRRLVSSFVKRGGDLARAGERLAPAIRAVEIHQATFSTTRKRLVDQLIGLGLDELGANRLAAAWLVQDDFLLTELPGAFDFVVGNPPYVRQERIPAALLKQYRRQFTTLYDRADLYVLFYERGLDLLTAGGHLAFICANRWTKNKYGGPLRAKVARGFHLKVYVDLERADAFHGEVDAYPAITVIERGEGQQTATALHGRDDVDTLGAIVSALDAEPGAATGIEFVDGVARGSDPWLLDAPEVLPHLRALEGRCPTLEEAHAKVGIGVATGCDRVFIGDFADLPVEDTRKLPLAMAADLRTGRLEWSGQGVVNPWLPSGALAPFEDHPRFAAYMVAHAPALKQRHTARKAPDKWYRTIDRIWPELTTQPKLLIPDIKGDATVVYDAGTVYPHHNLYVVTSDVWDLRALQALLRSSVALMFVAAYGVRMAGGFLRFQAQYLRRIRVPAWRHLMDDQREALVAVAEETDQARLDAAAFDAYGLAPAARAAIAAFAAQARVG